MCKRLLAVVLCPLGLAGCGGAGGKKADTQESIARESIKTFSEYADILETITDKASAEKAKPRIERLQKELVDQKARSEQLPNPGHEEAVKLSQKLLPESRAVMLRVEREMKRLQNIPGVVESFTAPMLQPPGKDQ